MHSSGFASLACNHNFPWPKTGHFNSELRCPVLYLWTQDYVASNFRAERLELPILVLPLGLRRNRLEGIPVFGDLAIFDAEQIIE